MRIRASVVKNPGFGETKTQKNCHEHKNICTLPLNHRTHLLRICVSAYQSNKITA
jgi:hypothetical protein